MTALPTTSQTVNRLLKISLLASDTEDTRNYYNEPYQSAATVLSKQIWQDDLYIPTSGAELAAVLALADSGIYVSPITSLPLIQRWTTVTTTAVTGTQVAFYSPLLINTIPGSFTSGFDYQPKLYKDTTGGGVKGAEIPYNTGGWVVDSGSGILRFYIDAGSMTGLIGGFPPIVSIFRYVGRIGVSPGGSTSTTLLAASTNYGGSGTYWPEVGLAIGQTITEFATLLNDRIHGLAQATTPVSITTITPVVSGLISGRTTGTAAIVSNLYIGVTPPATDTFGVFLTKAAWTLASFIKNSGSPASIVNTVTIPVPPTLASAATISIISNQYTAGNFFQTSTAKISPGALSFPASVTQYSYGARVKDTDTNTDYFSGNATFFVDAAKTPSITQAYVLSFNGGGTPSWNFVSGVPLLPAGTVINVTTTADVIGFFYNQTSIARLSSAQIPTVLTATASTLPVSTTANTPAVISLDTTVNTGQFNTSFAVDALGKNVSGTESAAFAVRNQTNSGTASFYVDTVSSGVTEASLRVVSGTGQFPITAAFGATFDSTVLLSTNKELQYANGLFRYPALLNYSNFVGKQPSVDYSALTPDAFGNFRWVTFKQTGCVNMTSAAITINSSSGFSGGSWGINVVLYAIVTDGASTRITQWLDGNTTYLGSGSPGATTDGDAAYDPSRSSISVRTITFGPTPRTGVLFVRIGILNTASEKFASATIVPN